MKEILEITPGAEGFAVVLELSRYHPRTHHHDELEMNLVLTGKGNYLVGNRRAPLMAGSMIWLFPRQEHVLIDWSHDFSMWVIVFRSSLVARHTSYGARQLLRSPDPGDILCRQIRPRRVDVLDHIFQSAVEAKQDLEFVNTTLGYGLVESWRTYLFSGEGIPRVDVHPAVAKAARAIANATSSFSLNRLAREAGLSAARLSRLFKQQTGISLTGFQQQRRLERFLRLYRTGARYSLTEAALMAGFGSYAQFHRVFRRLMDQSPARYKRLIGAGLFEERRPFRQQPFTDY